MSLDKTRVDLADTVVLHIECTKTRTVMTLIDAYIGDMPPGLVSIFEEIKKQLSGSNKGMFTK
jgi:hypothetical protein